MNPSVESRSRFRGIWPYLLILTVVAAVYLLCLPRGVTFEDSGELITSAATLGVSHPPGYPLYNLFGHLFALAAPWADPAGPLNFMSVFFSVISLLLVFYLVRSATSDTAFSLCVSFFLAFSRTFWNTSVTAEVYLLNFFFYALLCLLFVKYVRKPEESGFQLGELVRAFCGMAFLTGFAAGNHQLIFLLFPGFLYLFLRSGLWRRFRIGHYALMVMMLVLGLAVYLYLPIRAASHPYMNWGDPSTWEAFRNVLSREQYGDVGLTFANASIYARQFLIINPLYEFFRMRDFHLDVKIGYLFLYLASYAFALFGFIRDKNKIFKNLMLINGIFYSFFIVILTNTPHNKEFTLKVFFIPFWLSFAYFFLHGVMEFLRSVSSKYLKFEMPVMLPASCAGFLALLGLMFNFPENNYRNYHFTADYAENMLNTTPYRSILLTVKDNETFPLWQYQGARLIRPDLAIVNYVTLSEEWYFRQVMGLHPEIDPGWRPDRSMSREKARNSLVAAIITANSGRVPVFSANKEIPLPAGYAFIPFGSLYQVVNTNMVKGQPFYGRDFVFRYRGIDRPLTEKNYDVMTLLTIQNYCLLFSDTASRLLQAKEYPLSLDYFFRAVRFNKVLDFEPNNFYNYYSIGLIYMSLNRLDLVKEFWQKAIAAQPAAAASEDIRKGLQSLEKGSALFSQAEASYNKGDYRTAIRYYQEELASGQSQAPARTLANIGDCYFNLEQVDQAQGYYLKALQKDGNYVNAYYNLGGCYLMKGDKRNALKTWEKGLSIDPRNDLLRQAIQRYGGRP